MAVGASTISIGQLRRSATLMRNSPLNNTSGSDYDNYSAVLTTRCFLETRGGTLDLQQGALNIEQGYKMICRFQTAIVWDTDSYWSIGGVNYRILNGIEIDDRPHWYQFNLQKR
jgi:Phage head-tail joining protein